MAEIRHWAEQTSAQLAELARQDPVAVLPIAAIEQHGPHLPLATDALIGAGLLDAACARYQGSQDLLLMPMISFGASLEHTGFAGTLSLSGTQMADLIEAVGAGVADAGIRRLVIFNSHGGNKAAIDTAALELRSHHDLFVVKANYFRFMPPTDAIAAEEQRHGLHGGTLETAMMAHLAPHLVHLDRGAHHESLGVALAREGYVIGPEGEAAFAWRAEDLHPTGVVGDSGRGDAALGAELIAHFADRLAIILADAGRLDLSRLGGDG